MCQDVLSLALLQEPEAARIWNTLLWKRQVNPKKPQNPNCQVISVQTESMQCHTAVEQGDHTLNLQTNTLLAASKKSKVHQKVIKSSSKVHQKFIKISQITISGSKISKVHQKFIKNVRSSCKITFAGDSFQLRTPLLLHYQSQHARICACARAHCARIRKRTCINVCIWTEKVCNSSTLLKGKFLLRSLTNAFVFQVVDSGNARVH